MIAHKMIVSRRSVQMANRTVASDGVNADILEIMLDGEWAGMDAWIAYFRREDAEQGTGPTAAAFMPSGEMPRGSVVIPAALIAEPGRVDVALKGLVGGDVRLTTEAAGAWLDVVSATDVEDEATEEQLTAAEQAIARASAAASGAEKVDAKVEEAEGGADVTVTDRTGASRTVRIHDGQRGAQGEPGRDGRGIKSIEADHDGVVTVAYTDETSQAFDELARVIEDAEAAAAGANAAAARESWHVSGDALVLGDTAYVSERRQALVMGRM